MKLLVIRHAIAEDREVWARTSLDDGERPLTARGVDRMEQAARGLRRMVEKLDAIATSPLVRAMQTARIVNVAAAFLSMVSVGARSGSTNFDEAARNLLLEAGARFDRKPVTALINILDNRDGTKRWAHFRTPPEKTA